MSNKLFKVNVSVVILNDKSEVLLMKRSQSEDVFPGLWGIPGGTLESTDKSLESCLNREVMEEVGVEIGKVDLISNNTRSKEDENKLYLVYKAQYKQGNPRPSKECEKVDWFKLQDLETLEFTPFTKELIEAVLKVD